MVLVILVFVFIILHLINKKKTRFVLPFILCFLFAYICSIRPVISADTSTYLYYYEASSTITDIKFSFGREYFTWIENWYINLCVFSNRLGLSFSQFLFVVAFVFNLISLYSLFRIEELRDIKVNKTGNIVLTLTLFFVNYGFLYSYVVMRGGLSFSLCLLAYSFVIKEGKWNKIIGILIYIIAIALHNYSLIFIIIYLISLVKFKKNHQLFFIFTFILLVFLNLLRVDVLFTNYLQSFSKLFEGDLLQVTHYLLDSEQTSSIKKGILIYLLQNVLLAFMYLNSDDLQVNNDFLIILLGSIIAVLINDNATIRITNYFFVFQIFMYAKYFYRVGNNRNGSLGFSKDKAIYYVFIVFFIGGATLYYMLRYCSII